MLQHHPGEERRETRSECVNKKRRESSLIKSEVVGEEREMLNFCVAKESGNKS